MQGIRLDAAPMTGHAAVTGDPTRMHAEDEAGFSAAVRKPIDPLLFVRAVA